MSALDGIFLSAQKAGAKTEWHYKTLCIDAHAVFVWKFGKIQHFFVAPGLADFFIKSAKESTPDYYKCLPDCPRVPIPAHGRHIMTMFALKQDEAQPGTGYMPANPDIPGGFAIHFPAYEHRRSIVVIPRAVVPNIVKTQELKVPVFERALFVATDGEDIVLFAAGSGGEYQLHYEPDSTESTHALNKLILGFSLYVDAFPETVTDAQDNDIHDANHYRGYRAIVASNDIVESEVKRSVDPHWRIGHFHLLRSERFVHKKGQTVWTRGTYVKGYALDIVNPDACASEQDQTETTAPIPG